MNESQVLTSERQGIAQHARNAFEPLDGKLALSRDFHDDADEVTLAEGREHAFTHLCVELSG